MKSKNKCEKPAKLQLHVYYTSQAVMVQGHRKVAGVKGFKLLVESFFQPYIEMAMNNIKENIERTKTVLDMVGKEDTPQYGQEVAENIVNDLVKEASNTIKKVLSTKCEGKFTLSGKLEEHIQRVHIEKVKESYYQCEKCQDQFKDKEKLYEHMQTIHIDKSIIESEANNVILSIIDKFKKFRDDNMDESASLKRTNSTSPNTLKTKSSKITKLSDELEPPLPIEIKLLETEEDLKLVKKECEDVKMENNQLRKNLEETDNVKRENTNLRKQLKDQELESVNAMKAIEQRIEVETDTAMKAIQKQFELESQNKVEQNMISDQKGLADLEKEYKKKLSDLKEEKDRILGDLVKLQAENDIAKEKDDSLEKSEKMKRNLKKFNAMVNKEDETITKDECIRVISCEGDCDNVSQLKRLNSLKQSGSSRSCPQSKSTGKPMLNCDKCDFLTQNNEYFNSHMKGHDEKKIASNVT